MVEADQNNSNKAVQLPPELIGLGKALQQFFTDISLPGPLVSGWTYVVLPRPLNVSIKHEIKREQGILELDAAMDNQDLVPFVHSKKTGRLIQLLRWREHQRGYHHEIIIAGVMKASIGDEYWRYRDWDDVLLRDAFKVWREQWTFEVWRERWKRPQAAASVREMPAAAESVGEEQADLGSAAAAVPPARVSESAQASQSKRGRKPYDTWSLFHAVCIRQLDSDAVEAHTDVNIEDIANKLMAWGEKHVGPEKTPGPTKMREEVTKWVSVWKCVKEHEDEARRETTRRTQNK